MLLLYQIYQDNYTNYQTTVGWYNKIIHANYGKNININTPSTTNLHPNLKTFDNLS